MGEKGGVKRIPGANGVDDVDRTASDEDRRMSPQVSGCPLGAVRDDDERRT
jgi:hypothetical protein